MGGVDADDSFSAGGVAQVPAYLGQGVIYAFEQGQFSVSGGVPTGMHFSIDETITDDDCRDELRLRHPGLQLRPVRGAVGRGQPSFSARSAG